MKSKRNTYILLAAALLVWSYLVFRIVLAFNPKEDSAVVSNFKTMDFSAPEVAQDSFRLFLDYRDPFLGKTFKVPSKPNSISKPTTYKAPKKPEASKIPIKFPAIKYKGMISGKGAMLAIIEINGTEHIAQQGQEISGVKLVEFGEESIKVMYKEEERSYNTE